MSAPKMPSRTLDKIDINTRIVPAQKAFSLFTRRSHHRPIHGSRLSGGLSLDVILGLRRPQVAVDRRCAHRQQFLPHLRAITVTAEDQLAVAFQPVELDGHRGSQILPTLPTRGGP